MPLTREIQTRTFSSMPQIISNLFQTTLTPIVSHKATILRKVTNSAQTTAIKLLNISAILKITKFCIVANVLLNWPAKVSKSRRSNLQQSRKETQTSIWKISNTIFIEILTEAIESQDIRNIKEIQCMKQSYNFSNRWKLLKVSTWLIWKN